MPRRHAVSRLHPGEPDRGDEDGPMHLRLALAGLSLPALLWLTTGCQGRPIPLTAVKGSTMVIPLENPTGYDRSVAPIGYGGTQLPEDYQRGRLIYQLTDGVGGPLVLDANGQPIELITRATATAAPSRRAPKASIVHSLGSETLVSVVDIPTTAPTGTFGLHVVNRRIEGGQAVDTPWAPERQPSSQFEIVGVTGDSTPFEAFFNNWLDVESDLPLVVPQPAVEIDVTTACALSSCTGSAPPVAAVELEILYPDAVIDIANVISTHATAPVLVWSDDDAVGTLRVSAVRPDTSIGSIYLVFTLDNGASQILDIVQLAVTVLRATDPEGVEISGQWEVVAEPLAVW